MCFFCSGFLDSPVATSNQASDVSEILKQHVGRCPANPSPRGLGNQSFVIAGQVRPERRCKLVAKQTVLVSGCLPGPRSLPGHDQSTRIEGLSTPSKIWLQELSWHNGILFRAFFWQRLRFRQHRIRNAFLECGCCSRHLNLPWLTDRDLCPTETHKLYKANV